MFTMTYALFFRSDVRLLVFQGRWQEDIVARRRVVAGFEVNRRLWILTFAGRITLPSEVVEPHLLQRREAPKTSPKRRSGVYVSAGRQHM